MCEYNNQRKIPKKGRDNKIQKIEKKQGASEENIERRKQFKRKYTQRKIEETITSRRILGNFSKWSTILQLVLRFLLSFLRENKIILIRIHSEKFHNTCSEIIRGNGKQKRSKEGRSTKETSVHFYFQKCDIFPAEVQQTALTINNRKIYIRKCHFSTGIFRKRFRGFSRSADRS